MKAKTTEEILSDYHWRFDNYKQRMTREDWKQILLNEGDKIIYKGTVVPLKATNLGYGVVEVCKELEK